MSAYIVTKNHILYLLSAITSRRITRTYGFSYYHNDSTTQVRLGDYDQLAAIGSKLWQENVKSVNARYNDATDSEAYTIQPHELASVHWQEIEPVQVIKACHCLNYQSCEHEAWETSEAKTILDRLINAACHALTGYDDAAWGAPETTSAKRARLDAELRPKIAAQLARN